MKVFVFSRRFLIPFILALIGYAGYFAWEMWQLYKIDFNGKGISSSVKYEWLWTIISGGTILSAVLLALFTGIIFYSHYRIRREERALFYSSGNIAAILIIAIAGFVYTSFYEPRSYKRSMDLLSSIVYARTAEEFNSEINRKDDGLRNERMLTLPELCNAKDSLSAGSKTTGKYNFFDTPESMLKKIKFQIAKKAGYPFLLLIFYTIGVLLAVSLRKIHVVFPLLIAFLYCSGDFYMDKESLNIGIKQARLEFLQVQTQ
ncbi:MAG: hypothetical protein WDN26_23615 [Chitinophagaceae bacterium]